MITALHEISLLLYIEFQKQEIEENNMIIIVAVILLIIITFALLPPSNGKLKNGCDYEVCEKTYLDVDDTKIGLVIKGKKANAPVLLFLGGGPGIPEYWSEYQYPTGIDGHFIVCWINYRGTVLSYDKKLNQDEITQEAYINDAVKITDYLRDRFHQNKIYLMGHSFGTTISLLISKKYPEKFKAYIAMSMCTDQFMSEKIAYYYMVHQYQKQGNKTIAKQLKKYADLFDNNSTSFKVNDKHTKKYFSLLRDKTMHQLGIGTTHNMKSVITGILLPTLRMTEFTPRERINIWRGKIFIAGAPIDKNKFNFNSYEVADKLDLPFYVFAGKYDYTTNYSLQKKYFEHVSSDIKGFYTFENSAHSPLFEESKKAIEIITKDILNNTVVLADKEVK